MAADAKSVQERLQLKRVSLDKWSSKEQLCLASAVAFSGDQNWMSVSRALKMICNDSNRPPDWFSQKFCAIEYGKLLENVETPKRKKRTASERDSVVPDTPGESIVRKLTQERIEELQKVIDEERTLFNKIREEVLFLQSEDVDDASVLQMWDEVEAEKKQKEMEQQQREKWMREREERKLEMERAWRPSLAYHHQSSQSPKSASPRLQIKPEQTDAMDIEEASPQKPGTSPLLTSLLKSPSPAPNTTQIIGSPSSRMASAAPTITNLLSSGGHIPILSMDVQPTTQFQQVQNLFPSSATATVVVNQSAAAQAPTLTKLLDNRSSVTTTPVQPTAVVTPTASTSFAEQAFTNQQIMNSNFSLENENDDNSDGKDEENLMEVFKNLIPDDLADILSDNTEMILNPELLDEEKMLVESLMNEAEELPDVDDESSKPEVEVVAKSEPPSATEELPSKQESISMEIEGTVKTAVVPTDSVVVIDDSPKSDEKPISDETGSEAENVHENDENVVMEILSDEEEKQVSEDSAKPNEETVQEAEFPPEIDISVEPVEPASTESNEPAVTEEKMADIFVEPKKKDEPASREMPKLEPKDDVFTIEDTEMEKEKKVEEEPEKTAPAKEEVVEEPVAVTFEKDTLAEVKIKEEIIEEAEEKLKEPNASEIPERKISSDEEIFEDAKDTVDPEHPTKITTEAAKPLALQEKYSATIIDTDDDSPIEVIKEDKIGKTKRDYSRKKPEIVVTDTSKSTDDKHKNADDETSSSKTTGFHTRMKKKEQRDGSESPMVSTADDDQASDHSAPPRTRRRHSSTPVVEAATPTPSATSDDREHRAWKKSILIVFSRFNNHKHASTFQRVCTDDAYKQVIHRPMDLFTIKKNIENGCIRTTSEFFSNIFLMCQNAIMYYKKEHVIHRIAKELMAESIKLWEVEKLKEVSEKPQQLTVAAATGPTVVQSVSTVSSTTSSPVAKRPGRKSQRLPQNS